MKLEPELFLSNMLNLAREMEKESNKLERIGVKIEFLERLPDKIINFTLDCFGVPQDNTSETWIYDQDGQLVEIPDHSFCRDSISDTLYGYMDQEKGISETIKIFKTQLQDIGL